MLETGEEYATKWLKNQFCLRHSLISAATAEIDLAIKAPVEKVSSHRIYS
jgi:hypothetical protein